VRAFADPVHPLLGNAAVQHDGASVAPEADALQELQHAFGNRAPAQLLSPRPAELSLQRWAGYAGWMWGRAAQQPTAYTVTVDGIGTFSAKWFHEPPLPTHGWEARQSQERERAPKESRRADFTVGRKTDELSSALRSASAEGRHIPKVEIVMEKPPRRVVLRFNEVLVSIYAPQRMSGGDLEALEEITFNGVLDLKNSRF
jgi:hypothetical protein